MRMCVSKVIYPGIHMYLCVFYFAYMPIFDRYTCMCIHVCIYTENERESEGERTTEREIEIKNERERKREKDGYRYI